MEGTLIVEGSGGVGGAAEAKQAYELVSFRAQSYTKPMTVVLRVRGRISEGWSRQGTQSGLWEALQMASGLNANGYMRSMTDSRGVEHAECIFLTDPIIVGMAVGKDEAEPSFPVMCAAYVDAANKI